MKKRCLQSESQLRITKKICLKFLFCSFVILFCVNISVAQEKDRPQLRTSGLSQIDFDTENSTEIKSNSISTSSGKRVTVVNGGQTGALKLSSKKVTSQIITKEQVDSTNSPVIKVYNNRNLAEQFSEIDLKKQQLSTANNSLIATESREFEIKSLERAK